MEIQKTLIVLAVLTNLSFWTWPIPVGWADVESF